MAFHATPKKPIPALMASPRRVPTHSTTRPRMLTKGMNPLVTIHDNTLVACCNTQARPSNTFTAATTATTIVPPMTKPRALSTGNSTGSRRFHKPCSKFHRPCKEFHTAPPRLTDKSTRVKVSVLTVSHKDDNAPDRESTTMPRTHSIARPIASNALTMFCAASSPNKAAKPP